MSGYENERSLFYHLIIWIGWIKVFPLMKKVEKQFMKMMVPQVVELVSEQTMLHKKVILILVIKVRLLEQSLQVLVMMIMTMGVVGGMLTLLGAVEELVALVRILEEMVALVAVMLVKQILACPGHKEMKITMPHKIQIMDINQGYGNNKSI